MGANSILFSKEMLFTACAKGPIKILRLTKLFLKTCEENFYGIE
jgi:hypothetical protein